MLLPSPFNLDARTDAAARCFQLQGERVLSAGSRGNGPRVHARRRAAAQERREIGAGAGQGVQALLAAGRAAGSLPHQVHVPIVVASPPRQPHLEITVGDQIARRDRRRGRRGERQKRAGDLRNTKRVDLAADRAARVIVVPANPNRGCRLVQRARRTGMRRVEGAVDVNRSDMGAGIECDGQMGPLPDRNRQSAAEGGPTAAAHGEVGRYGAAQPKEKCLLLNDHIATGPIQLDPDLDRNGCRGALCRAVRDRHITGIGRHGIVLAPQRPVRAVEGGVGGLRRLHRRLMMNGSARTLPEQI